jgi:DNA polymerase III epsilon subunit-like protein
MLVCGVDFETTGLEPGKDFITEIGAVLFHDSTWEVRGRFSRFVYEPKALPLSEDIVRLTGITDKMLTEQGVPTREALLSFADFSSEAVAFVAHNKDFDQGMFKAEVERSKVELSLATLNKSWYCSKGDIKAHEGKRCTKLSHLAVDYGLVVDGGKLHRALDDVLLMGQMIAATKTSFIEMKTYAEEPWVYIQAITKGPWVDGGKSTNEAKKLGFAWEKCNGTYSPIFSKKWVKRVKKSALEEELKKPAETFQRLTIQAPA